MVKPSTLYQEKPPEVSCSTAVQTLHNCTEVTILPVLLTLPLSRSKGNWGSQSEGRTRQANQKASGVNRTGTSWWWNPSILLTYDDMIDFPSECSNVGLSSTSFSTPTLSPSPSSLNLPSRPSALLSANGQSLCLSVSDMAGRADEWKKQLQQMKGEILECNFPSVNLPSRGQLDHQSVESFLGSWLQGVFEWQCCVIALTMQRVTWNYFF